MIRWCYNNRRIGVQAAYLVAGIGNTRRCITHYRLAKDLLVFHIQKLFFYQISVSFICYYINVFFRYYMKKTVVGSLYESFSCSQNVDELFGMVCLAYRPEPAANASGHNNSIKIFHEWFM